MELPMAKAINAGLRAAMLADDAVMLMGEDIAQLGGVFRVTEGLQEQLGLVVYWIPHWPKRALWVLRLG